MSISVIIPTYNRKNVLRHVILSISKQTLLPDEVFICDDGSNDGTKEEVENLKNIVNFKLEHLYQEKKGFRAAAARNMGINASTCEKIVFVDQDVILDKNAISYLDQIGKNGFLSGLKKLVPLKFYEETINDEVILNNFEVFEKQTFGNLKATLSSLGSIWKSDLEEVGNFSEDFIGYGLEDTDLIERLLFNKKKICFNGKCIGYHIAHNYKENIVSRQIQDIYHAKHNLRKNK